MGVNKKTKSKFPALLKKEIRDLVTVATIIPMVVMFLLFFFLGDIIKSMSAGDTGAVQAGGAEIGDGVDMAYSQTSIVGFMDLDKSELSRYIENNLMYLKNNPNGGIIPVAPVAGDPEGAMAWLADFVFNDMGVNWTTQTLVVIPEGFEESLLAGHYTSVDVYTSIESFGLASMMSGGSVYAVTSAINGLLSEELFRLYKDDLAVDLDINYISFINSPVYARDHTYLNGKTENVNASMIMGYVSSQTTVLPIAIFFIIMMSTQMLAGSIVNEKTDKTLETLMTTPLKRMSVLLAKIFSAALYAVIYAATYIIAYKRFMDSLGGDASYPEGFMEVLENFGITFNAAAFAVIGAQLFLSVLCGLAVSMLIGMMIEDIKTLQAYLMPLVFIIMIPYMLSMFVDLNTMPIVAQILLYAIPFTHTFTAATNLFSQNYVLIAFGMAYQLLFVAVLLTLAVRIFNSDKLFTLGQLMKKKTGISSPLVFGRPRFFK